MPSLVLKFNDDSGEELSVVVEKERCLIGRHSNCDLSISDGRLSREHLLIERIGDSFVVTERGSSNGTELNGDKLFNPCAINDGDVLSLGGFRIEIGIARQLEAETIPPTAEEPSPDASMRSLPALSSEPTASTGISTMALAIAAFFGIGILVVLGVLVLFSLSSGPTVDNSNFIYSRALDDNPTNRRTPEPGNSINLTADVPPETMTSLPGNATQLPTNVSIPDGGKTEAKAAAFLRKIAQNDPTAFITGGQAKIIDGKIKSLSGQSALVDNIVSARKNAAAIKSLAVSRNLKPDLLAVAAITALGGSRGDVLASAQKMADTLDKFGTQIGNERADDCLLMIAGYGQGDPMKMRNMLQSLATTATESSREIRTIWYLKKAGKITDAEYDFAVRFIAIGAIAQNPRDFGVNIEGLNF